MDKRLWLLPGLTLLVVILLLLVFRPGGKELHDYHNQGKVFGTYYSIRYLAPQDLEQDILLAFDRFDRSLSMFNPESVISAVNHNRDTVTDAYFEQMFREAMHVSQLSHGAFDITVAPLVNLWGFGFKHREDVTDQKVDSARSLIGYRRVQLIDHHVRKDDPRIMLDASAVAKGQACDVIAAVLREHGVEHYLVDIGGEVVAHGERSPGEPWRIGITTPTDDPTGTNDQLQDIVASRDICMATSGNYRNFYYEGSQRRSHTIDPRTGYPVQHSLLSATVVAETCMRADALATASMVLGADSALVMINEAGAKAYFIVSEGDTLRVITSKNWDLTSQK